MIHNLQPIVDINSDNFNFNKQAKNLILTLRKYNKSASVIVLDGRWGEGKTSLVNYAISLNDNRFNKVEDTNLIFLKYEPWNFEQEKDVTIQFLIHLYNQFQRKDFKGEIIKNIDTFMIMLSVLLQIPDTNYIYSMIPSGVKAAKKLISSKLVIDIQEQKRVISKILKESKTHICVVIDDVDRMRNDHILELLKVLKTIGDIEGITYLLPLDYELLKEKIAKTKAYLPDTSFTEKLISNIIKFCPPTQDTLKEYVFNEVNNLIKDITVHEDEKHDNHAVRTFKELLDGEYLTIRKAKLFLNAYSVSLNLYKKDINIFELLTLEFIRQFYPKIFNNIKQQRAIFTLSRQSLYEHNICKKQFDGTDKLSNLIKDVVTNDYANPFISSGDVIRGLFPALTRNNGFVNHTIYLKSNSISSKENFTKFFFINDSADFNYDDLLSFIQDYINGNIDLLIYIETLIDEKKFSLFKSQINDCFDFCSLIPKEKHLDLIIQLLHIDVENKIKNGKSNIFSSNRDYLRYIIIGLTTKLILNRTADKAQQLEEIKILFARINLPTKVRLYHYIGYNHESRFNIPNLDQFFNSNIVEYIPTLSDDEVSEHLLVLYQLMETDKNRACRLLKDKVSKMDDATLFNYLMELRTVSFISNSDSSTYLDLDYIEATYGLDVEFLQSVLGKLTNEQRQQIAARRSNRFLRENK